MPSALNVNKETQEDDTGLGPERKSFRLGQAITSKTVRYVLQRKIGDSKNGAVFEALNDRKELFALKFEWRGSEKVDPRLGMEASRLQFFVIFVRIPFHQILSISLIVVPSVVTMQVDGLLCLNKQHLQFMVTTLLAENLQRKLDTVKGRMFSKHTAVGVGIQVLDALRELHTLGYVHRDIRPHNLNPGLDEKSHVIFLMNFGQAAVYRKGNKTRKPRAHINPKVFRDLLVMLDNKSYYDTVDYDSIKSTIIAAAASAGVTNLNLNFDWEPKSGSQSSRSLRDLKKATEEESDSSSSRVESKMKFD
ncbi:putative serine/threonine-protein kinase [Aphelenchoides besseyi]|nr:putative serine/threonine-protein kinase [Aphelenchoides besseyi]